jgi:thiol-disulfide isomerase/thioredoxin/ribosomal protein S4
MKLFLLTFYNFFVFGSLYAQTIKGTLVNHTNQEIKLEGFDGLKTYPISNTLIDEKGNFKLTYSFSDYGIGYLMSSDNKPIFIMLNGEDIEISGESLSITETIKIKKGRENQLFEQYAKEHPKREQALSAWIYLEKIYTLDSLFTKHLKTTKAIQQEKQRIKKEDLSFINSMPKESYLRWFLPTRILVSSVSTIAQYRPEEIPEAINAFRNLDYSDQKLYKSGLLKDAIESHYWLLENMGKPLDTVFKEMNISSDYLINSLTKDEKKLNEITNYLFDLLERHSLFEASEYLALKALTQNSCTLNSDLAKQLETYRTMRKGNIAPDIVFAGDVYKNGTIIKKPSKLSEIKAQNTLVVFGASWCPKCVEEMSQLVSLYEKWKSKGFEVVFVSMDTDKTLFDNFVKDFPFTSTCEYKKWDSKAAQDYYVFASPTLFLLDNNMKIILRPNSVKQVDAWVDINIKL